MLDSPLLNDFLHVSTSSTKNLALCTNAIAPRASMISVEISEYRNALYSSSRTVLSSSLMKPVMNGLVASPNKCDIRI